MEFCTVPPMEPATFKGDAAKLSPTPARQNIPSARKVSVLCVFAFDIRRPRARVETRRFLGYRKWRGLCEHLVTVFIGNFQPQSVRPGGKLVQSQKFLDGHLAPRSVGNLGYILGERDDGFGGAT